MQNFTEIRQSATELWPKTTFETADVRHLQLWKCSYLFIWLLSSSNFAAVYQISSKLDDFSLRYGDFTIFKLAGLRSLEFYGSNNGFFQKHMWDFL